MSLLNFVRNRKIGSEYRKNDSKDFLVIRCMRSILDTFSNALFVHNIQIDRNPAHVVQF